MKRLYLFFIPFIFLMSGCLFFYTSINGSGRLVSNQYYISGFSGISASDPVNVTVTQANYYSVSVTCDDNILPYLNIYNDGYHINIELLSGYTYINSTIDVRITMPNMSSLWSRDGAFVQVSGFLINEDLNVNITNGSSAKLYLTDASDININLQSASYLETHSVYPVENISVTCQEASTADLGGMETYTADIFLRESSSLKVFMNGTITGQVSEASVLYYRGSNIPGPIIFSGNSGIVYY